MVKLLKLWGTQTPTSSPVTQLATRICSFYEDVTVVIILVLFLQFPRVTFTLQQLLLFVCFNSLQWVTLMFVQIRKTLLVREELTACVMHHATGIKKMAKCNQNSVDGYMYMVHWTATIGTMFLMLGSTPALWQVALQLHQKSLPVGQIITVPVLHGRYSITKA